MIVPVSNLLVASLSRQEDFDREVASHLRLDSYTEETLVAFLTSPIEAAPCFSPEDFALLVSGGITLHHHFVRADIQKIEEIFPNDRWRAIVLAYVKKYGLKPGRRFIEEFDRLLRKEPQNLFETAHGPLLRRTLREYWADARARGAPDVFFESFFSDLARHGIVTIGDIIFTSRKWWNTNYPPGSHYALHDALGELRVYLHADKGPEWFARPTAAELAELTPRP